MCHDRARVQHKYDAFSEPNSDRCQHGPIASNGSPLEKMLVLVMGAAPEEGSGRWKRKDSDKSSRQTPSALRGLVNETVG
jgi:hypothetical protein